MIVLLESSNGKVHKLPAGREQIRGWIPKCVGKKEEGGKEDRGKEIRKRGSVERMAKYVRTLRSTCGGCT